MSTEHDELGPLPTRTPTVVNTDARRFRDFDAEVAEAAGEPIEFTLSGEQFTCLNPLPLGSVAVFARRLAGLASQAQKPGLTNEEEVLLAMRITDITQQALITLIPPDQRERLDEALCRHSDPEIADKLYRWIVEGATARPTGPS